MESRHTLLGRSMKENKLGRKFANTWSPPRNRFATRMANKGVRKNARLATWEIVEQVQIGGTKRGLWLEGDTD